MTKIQEILTEYYDNLNKLLSEYPLIIRDDNSCILAFENADKRSEFTRKLNGLGAPYQYLPHNKIEVFFKDDRYTEKPHAFKLVKLSELPAVLIGPDGKCDCTSEDRCINSHKMHKNRCTLEELKKLSNEASNRRSWQSGGW